MEIENATITNAFIRIERGFVLTCGVTISGDSWGCCYGSPYTLHLGRSAGKHSAVGPAGEFIMRLMETFDVEDFKDLIGKNCRAKTTGFGGTIEGIGHIVKDKWFDAGALMTEYVKERDKAKPHQ